MDSISPELALVDEQLDSSARRALPDAPDCLAPPADDVERTVAVERKRPSGKLLTALVPVVLAVAFAVFALSDDPEPRRGADAGTAAEAPANRSNGPPRLRWPPVRGAAYYNVIFWRNGARALDLWPRAATVRVPEGRLAPGRYQWFVYPAFGEQGQRRYGKVAARGTLRV